ncbi:MAG: dihydrolipoyllysine-residue succinyltransferase, partial [Proteobacteria bacterium]|nr:dihydrolipoyllysine-residue succinyltransferase [Pseudomonadota bacterium]
MSENIVVPAAGESVSEAVVSAWLANEGEWVTCDAPVVVLETDKANLEVGAPIDGVLVRIIKRMGETV